MGCGTPHNTLMIASQLHVRRGKNKSFLLDRIVLHSRWNQVHDTPYHLPQYARQMHVDVTPDINLVSHIIYVYEVY